MFRRHDKKSSTDNPYLQYFIGLPGYQEEPPLDASTLVLFRKRINHKMIMDANETMLAATEEKKSNDDDHKAPPSDSGSSVQIAQNRSNPGTPAH